MRVKVSVDFTNKFQIVPFEIDNLEQIPRIGEIFVLEDFISEEQYSIDIIDAICDECFRVRELLWQKDEKGIFVHIWIEFK